MASVDWSSITDTHFIGNEFDDDDVAGAAIEHQPIYGRSKETLILLKAYQSLLQTKQSQTIILHGESGSGKTALVEVLRDRICDGTPGYFVTGKYFQNPGEVQEAHSAIMAAFSDLCDLVAQSPDFNEARSEQIRKQLGSDAAQLLVKSISNLSPILTAAATADIVGDDDDDDGGGGGHTNNNTQQRHARSRSRISTTTSTTPSAPHASAKSKFKMACKAFLRAMASEEHPVIVFLDDVQWADEGSRQLIQMFLQDSDLRNVMLILAYRDEEAEQAEDIIIHARPAHIDIQLLNLNAPAVYQMVSYITGSSSDNVAQLSELITKRTAGNPFYIRVLMETIQREELYDFDHETGSCIFKLDEIQAKSMASESLADLLTRKIDLLPSLIMETLKVASLLGYHFDESILVAVASAARDDKSVAADAVVDAAATVSTSGSSRESVLAPLAEAAKQGFIEATRGNGGYQFTHDKLQASFQSMISADEKNWLHLLIGRAFLARSDTKAKLYNAAVHLNSAPAFLHNEEQRVVLARINLQAAAYCKEKSAFIRAVTMLRTGLNLFDSAERWSDKNINVTLEISEALARMQLIVGDFEGCKMTTSNALCHCTTVEVKIKFLLIEVEVTMAGSEVDASLSTTSRALAILGVTMPPVIKWHHVVMKMLKVRYMLSRRSDDDILNLPITDDFLLTTTIKLLAHVSCHSFIKDDSFAFIYASLLGTELTLKTGYISPYSPGAFAIYGIAECGNAARAYRFNKLSLAILERLPCKEAECYTLTFTASLLRAKTPLSELLAPFCRASDSGHLRGDLLHASHSSAQSFHVHNYLGTHLTEVEDSMRKRYEMMSDLSQENLLLSFQPALQYVLNMQSDVSSWVKISILSGEAMQEENFFGQANQFLTLMGYLVKAEIAASFDQFHLAESIYENIQPMEDIVRIFYFAPFYFWNAARTNFTLYSFTAKRIYLRQGRRLRRVLERMKSDGCPNATPLVAFLDAEQMAKQHKGEEAALRVIYDRGIDCLAKHKFLPIEGILNEKAGFDLARRGWYTGAKRYFLRALHIYSQEWGAMAKYNWLEIKHQQALKGMMAEQESVRSPYGTCITVDQSLENN